MLEEIKTFANMYKGGTGLLKHNKYRYNTLKIRYINERNDACRTKNGKY